MTQFKEKGERQGVRLGRPLHLPGADGGRHPALPDRHRPDRRRPAPARRARARRRGALQLALRRDVHGAARASIPEVGARIMDLQEPTKKMSTTGGTPQGTVLAARRARRDPQEVQDGRHRLGHARCATRRREARRLEPDRDPLGRDRRADAEAIEARYDGQRLRRLQERRRRGGRRAVRADPGALRASCAPTRASCAGCSRVGAEKAREASAADAASRCTSGWASSGSGASRPLLHGAARPRRLELAPRPGLQATERQRPA